MSQGTFAKSSSHGTSTATAPKPKAEPTTEDLINDAKVSDATKVTTGQELEAATQKDAQANMDKVAKHQAVYDDLVAKGPYLYVDKTTTPETYFVTTPVAPSDFAMAPIRSV